MTFLQKILKEDTIIPPKINVQTLFYLLIIILAALKQLYGVQQHLDIPFFDETEYLQKGIGLQHHVFNDWGPSYNLWYFALSKVSSNAVQTFYLNYSLLNIILPVLLFLFLINYGIQKNTALLFSLSFLMQPLLVSNFTYVSHFCLLSILIAFILMPFTKNNETKIVLAILASYICMYARQEFLLITVSLILLWLILLVYRQKIKFSIAYVTLFISVIGLYIIFGFISFRAQGIDRSLFAFKQHFYTNYVFWTKKALTLDQFDALDIFHGSKTMFQCMLANPAMFTKHIDTNILNYLINFYKYIENFILPHPVFHYLGKGKHILFLAFIIYLFYIIFKQKAYKNITEFIQQNTFTSILMVVFFGWSFFSIVFIFPERHYFILQFIWWFLLIALLLKNSLNWLNNKFIFYPLVLLFLIFTPTSKSIGYYHNMMADAAKQPNLKTVQYLKKNNAGMESIIFTTERGFNTYLPKNYHELFLEQEDIRPYVHDNQTNIQRFLQDKNISIIFMNEKLQHLFSNAPGDECKLLLNEPEKMGYKKKAIGNDMKAYLLIKER